jgi:hypothetical protein
MTKPTTDKQAAFTPTAAMIKAAENVFVAIAFEQTVRPIVEGYQRKILAERTWRCAPEYIERAQRRASDEPVEQNVSDIKLAWTRSPTSHALSSAATKNASSPVLSSKANSIVLCWLPRTCHVKPGTPYAMQWPV